MVIKLFNSKCQNGLWKGLRNNLAERKINFFFFFFYRSLVSIRISSTILSTDFSVVLIMISADDL